MSMLSGRFSAWEMSSTLMFGKMLFSLTGTRRGKYEGAHFLTKEFVGQTFLFSNIKP